MNNSALRGAVRHNPVTGPYFTTTDITNPVGNVYGNAARDFILCPGLDNWDISFFKKIPLWERLNVQFRADLFNIFNHAQFMNPGGNITGSSFGIVTNARDPRIGQLSAKFYW